MTALHLSALDWLGFLSHFFMLSLLAVGGAITTAPDMHRYLVVQQSWLTDSQFANSIALAQAAPGPNILFVALLGWNVGLNTAGALSGTAVAGLNAWLAGLLGVTVAMTGILLPSTLLTYWAARWGHHNKDRQVVRAFKQGMAPLVIGLLIATGWILAHGQSAPTIPWRLWLLTGMATLLMWRTRIHLLWLLAAGGVLGGLGWV